LELEGFVGFNMRFDKSNGKNVENELGLMYIGL
jgi:hypothetical protein